VSSRPRPRSQGSERAHGARDDQVGRADLPREISRRAGISKPTVSIALQSLLDVGLVRSAEPEGDGRGTGATFFEPGPRRPACSGLDLGGASSVEACATCPARCARAATWSWPAPIRLGVRCRCRAHGASP
jgi:DNA-binding transcriptional ArsR family regulator